MANCCATCKKTAPEVPNLKLCAKCKTASYCSRECQKADWKVHKKVCAKNAGDASSASHPETVLRNLEMQVQKPFTRLDNNTYLHQRPENDVFKLLVDSFRIRQADDYNFEGKIDPDSIYNGTASSVAGFRKFLLLATSRPGLLPSWCNGDKQEQCERYGMQSTNWSNLKTKVDKQGIIEHYGDPKMPMQLRMLAEIVYGRGTRGQDGTAMRRMMKKTENGEGVSSMFSM